MNKKLEEKFKRIGSLEYDVWEDYENNVLSFIDEHFVEKEERLTCSQVHPECDVYHKEGHLKFGKELSVLKLNGVPYYTKEQVLEMIGEDGVFRMKTTN